MTGDLTYTSTKILEALAVYRYLTPHLMVKAGVSTSVNSVRNKLLPHLKGKGKEDKSRKNLKKDKRFKGKYVDWRKYGSIPGRGQIPHVFCLNKKGAQALADDLGVDVSLIPYTVGGVKFVSDYDHRLALIEFHIYLRSWVLQHDGRFVFDRYFDKMPIGQKFGKAKRFQAKTCIALKNKRMTIEPDAISKFYVNGQVRLCAIELHHNNLAGKIVEQILDNVQAVKEGVIPQKFNHDKSNFILSIYHNENTMRLVKERLSQSSEFKGGERVVIFNSLRRIREEFTSGWHFIDGETANLFPSFS